MINYNMLWFLFLELNVIIKLILNDYIRDILNYNALKLSFWRFIISKGYIKELIYYIKSKSLNLIYYININIK